MPFVPSFIVSVQNSDRRPSIWPVGLACFAALLSDIAPVFCTVHCKDITAPWQRIPGADVGAAIAAGLESCVRVFCVSDYTRCHLLKLAPRAVAETLTPGLAVASLGATPSKSYFTPPEARREY